MPKSNLAVTLTGITGRYTSVPTLKERFNLEQQTVETLYAGCKLLYEQGKEVQALEGFAQLSTLDGKDYRFPLGIALCAGKLGDRLGEMVYGALAAALAPKDPLLNFWAGNLLLQVDQKEAAKTFFERVLEGQGSGEEVEECKRRAQLSLERL